MHRTSGALAFLLAALVVNVPVSAGAQRIQSSVLVGGVGVRYAGDVDVTAVNVHPSISLQAAHLFLSTQATLSSPTSGGWNAQGLLAGSAFTPSAGALSAELSSALGGSRNSFGFETRQAHLIGRGHASGARGGLWVGAGGGRVFDGARWRTNRIGEVGGWLQLSTLGLTATYSPSAADDSLRFRDAVVSARWRAPRVELDASFGVRHRSGDLSAAEDPDAWGSVSASLRLSPRVALVASGGSYPRDPLQGFPAGRFTFLGMRITGPGSAPAPAIARSVLELTQERVGRSGLTGFRVSARSNGQRVIRVRAPEAQRVELAGDFTQWVPVAMTAAADGWWSVTLPLQPGSYELNFRIDGGGWIVPPELPTRRDEFGGVSGLLTVR